MTASSSCHFAFLYMAKIVSAPAQVLSLGALGFQHRGALRNFISYSWLGRARIPARQTKTPPASVKAPHTYARRRLHLVINEEDENRHPRFSSPGYMGWNCHCETTRQVSHARWSYEVHKSRELIPSVVGESSESQTVLESAVTWNLVSEWVCSCQPFVSLFRQCSRTHSLSPYPNALQASAF
jgi:hypothetical protein